MKRKAISSLLCVLAILQMSVTPAYATNITQQTSTPGNQSATITYDQGSKFTVTIPKTIELGSNKSVEYTVKVEGDISGNETITITPDSTITLNDADGKGAVTGNIEQTKTEFNSTEVNQADGASTTGTITANDLTAGDWSGSISFTIGKDQEVIGEDITLTSSNLATYGIATTGDVEIPKYVADSDGVKHKVVGIRPATFYNCKGLISITIPDSVTNIGRSAFNDCSGLTSVTIPDSVTNIGDRAFSCCTSLTSITIPDSVKSIEERAFNACENLTSITIPDSVTSIEECAFMDCAKLASVTYKGQTYTSKSALKTALTNNNVTVGTSMFDNTALHL